ncbi:DUF4091 domain-containing protein [bacterium]|nr:DUF4091 domain-containing protein [bacterium]
MKKNYFKFIISLFIILAVTVIFIIHDTQCGYTSSSDQEKIIFYENFKKKAEKPWDAKIIRHNKKKCIKLPIIDNKYFGAGISYSFPAPVVYDKNLVLELSVYTPDAPFIYLSFFNKNKNDNYHFRYKNIKKNSWQTIKLNLSWFTDNEYKGKPLNNGDVITKINFFSGNPRSNPTIYIDEIKLFLKQTVKSSSANNSKTFFENFENTSRSWKGILSKNLPGGKNGSAVKAIDIDDKWFGVCASYENADSPIFVIDKNPMFSISYYIEKKRDIYVSFFNKTKNDNYHYRIKNIKLKKWTDFKQSLLFFTDNSYKGIPMDPGDELTNIRIFAGRPRESVNLWLDNIKIETKELAPSRPFNMQKRKYAEYTQINRSIIANLRKIYNKSNRPKSILNVGDSISFSMAFMWPMRWNKPGLTINEGYKYIDKNAAAKSDMKSNWGKNIIDSVLKNIHPQTATILFGTNDVLKNANPAKYYDNMEYIIDACIKHGTIPILLTIPPTTKKSIDTVKKFNYQLRELARTKKIPVLDIFQLFMDQNNWRDLLSDGIHPSYFEDSRAGGYSLINESLYEMYKMIETYVINKPKKDLKIITDNIPFSEPESSSIIFKYTFDRSKEGWNAILVKGDDAPDSKNCLMLKNGQELTAKLNAQFNVTPSTYIAVSVYAESCKRFRLQIYNKTQNDNFWAAYINVPQKQWTRYYFDLNNDFQDNELKHKQIFFHDNISAINFYGDVIERTSKLYIDDIVVYNATLKSYNTTLDKQFNSLQQEFDKLKPFLNFSVINKTITLHKNFVDNLKTSTPEKLQNILSEYKNLMFKSKMLIKTKKFFSVENPSFGVGYETAMKRISPYHRLYNFKGDIKNNIKIYSAKHEYEIFQLYLVPFGHNVKNVSITFSDLINEDKKTLFKKDNFKSFIEDFVVTKQSWPVSKYILGKKPDPLIPLRKPFILRDETPFLISCYTPPEQKAGKYTGKIIITSDNNENFVLDISLYIWDFNLPLYGRLHTPTTLDFNQLKEFYGSKPNEQVRRKWYKFCLQHRIDPTDLYHFGLSPRLEDIDYCNKLGLRTILFGGNHYSEDIKNKQYVNKTYLALKEKKLLRKTMIYIADEPSPDNVAVIIKKAGWIRKNCPGLLTFAGTNPTASLYGYIDVWDPIISGGAHLFDPEITAERKKAGEKVMWYVAASPSYPYPNIQMDNPLIDARILLWMTFKYDIDGFEYYYINLWGNNKYAKNGKKWPDIPWDTYSFTSSRNNYNGDGMLIYPGKNMEPYSSLRLENLRDGIEDFETLNILKNLVAEIKSKNIQDNSVINLIQEAQEIINVPAHIVKNTITFTRNPDDIISARIKTGYLIEKLKKYSTGKK